MRARPSHSQRPDATLDRALVGKHDEERLGPSDVPRWRADVAVIEVFDTRSAAGPGSKGGDGSLTGADPTGPAQVLSCKALTGPGPAEPAAHARLLVRSEANAGRFAEANANP